MQTPPVLLSERDVILLDLLRSILAELKLLDGVGGGESGGGGGSASIDYEALANAIAAKTLAVTGDSVNETALASAIATALNLPSTYLAALTAGSVNGLADAIAAKTLTTSGSTSVSNFPATQPVSLASLPTLPTGSNTIGAISITNFPTTQLVSGTVAFSNSSLAIADATTPANKLGINGSGQIGISNFPTTQAVSLSTLPPLATGNNTIGNISNTSFASTQSGVWSTRAQDGSGNSLTSQVNGSGRALDVGIAVSGTQIDPRSIRTLTSSDVVSVVQGGAWNINNISGSIAQLPTALVSGRLSVDGSAVTQPVSIASLPALAAGSNTIGAISNSTFASTQSGTWNTRTQDGSGNSLTSQTNGSQRALDVGVLVSGVQVDPRSIRALTSSDVVSAAQSGNWITRTQDGSGNNITSQVNGSQRALDVGVLVSGVQVDPRSIRALTSSDIVSAVQSGTWNIGSITGTVNVTQISNAATASVTFTSSATSSTFTLANRLILAVIPAITGAPTLTLQVSLDSGTTWVNTSVTIQTSASATTVLEADSFARVGGALGLTNAFRFSSTASITSATISIRNVVQ